MDIKVDAASTKAARGRHKTNTENGLCNRNINIKNSLTQLIRLNLQIKLSSTIAAVKAERIFMCAGYYIVI